MPLNGTNIVRKNKLLTSINHKSIRNYSESPSARQNHQESTKCTSTRHTRLEHCLTTLNKIDRLTFTTLEAQLV